MFLARTGPGSMPMIPALKRQRQKDQHLKFTLLSDIVSSKSAWATRDPGVLVHTTRVNLESIIHMKETRFKSYVAYDVHSDGMSQIGKSMETQSDEWMLGPEWR